jgi:hypothetical protein
LKPSNKGLYLFLLGLGAFTSTILAQTPGTFTATGNMNTARVGHTATLLADGKVLIAGGVQWLPTSSFTQTVLASAELYDPERGTFTSTADMATPRAGHGAVLLPDGRVLIVGGGSTSMELYDPSTRTFTLTGDITKSADRWPTLLANGKVLITGGSKLVAGAGSATGAELYDPASNTLAATGAYARTDQLWGASLGVTMLADGRVLISWVSDDDTELYDPGTGTFTPTGRSPWSVPGTLLTNGQILFAGGFEFPDSHAALYDPSIGTFATTGNMITARTGPTQTLLPDSTVLIAGGSLPYGVTLANAEVYNIATGTFGATGDMNMSRYGHTATVLSDGRVLVAGGNPYWTTATSAADLYHPAVMVTAPVLLSLSGDGVGQGAIQHAGTYRIASADDPAVAGEYLSIYLTGLAEGSAIPPQVAIGGRVAEITFFGNVPGYPGLNVINVRMPSGVAPGPALPVRLTYLSRTSNAVTIGAR